MAMRSTGFRLEVVTAVHNVILMLWSLGMFIFISIDIVSVYMVRSGARTRARRRDAVQGLTGARPRWPGRTSARMRAWKPCFAPATSSRCEVVSSLGCTCTI